MGGGRIETGTRIERERKDGVNEKEQTKVSSDVRKEFLGLCGCESETTFCCSLEAFFVLCSENIDVHLRSLSQERKCTCNIERVGGKGHKTESFKNSLLIQ